MAVKSSLLLATGTVKSGTTRLYGISFMGLTAAVGNLVLRDGGGGGSIVFEIDASRVPNGVVYSRIFPNPIRCGTDLHATLTTVAVTPVEFNYD